LFTHGSIPYYTGAEEGGERLKSSRPVWLLQQTKGKDRKGFNTEGAEAQRTKRRGPGRKVQEFKSPRVLSLRVQEGWRGG
jgi:hypothetical protein